MRPCPPGSNNTWCRGCGKALPADNKYGPRRGRKGHPTCSNNCAQRVSRHGPMRSRDDAPLPSRGAAKHPDSSLTRSKDNP